MAIGSFGQGTGAPGGAVRLPCEPPSRHPAHPASAGSIELWRGSNCGEIGGGRGRVKPHMQRAIIVAASFNDAVLVSLARLPSLPLLHTSGHLGGLAQAASEPSACKRPQASNAQDLHSTQPANLPCLPSSDAACFACSLAAKRCTALRHSLSDTLSPAVHALRCQHPIAVLIARRPLTVDTRAVVCIIAALPLPSRLRLTFSA